MLYGVEPTTHKDERLGTLLGYMSSTTHFPLILGGKSLTTAMAIHVCFNNCWFQCIILSFGSVVGVVMGVVVCPGYKYSG